MTTFKSSGHILRKLNKAIGIFDRGRLRAFNLQVKGTSNNARFLGMRLTNVVFNLNDGSFTHDGTNYTFNYSDIYKVKRLRTRKYLFNITNLTIVI